MQSPSVQAIPSATGVPAQSPFWSHASAVHSLPSSHDSAPRHSPLTQTSPTVQACVSSQFAPFAAAALLTTPLGSAHESTVQALPSSVTSGTPATHPVVPSAPGAAGAQVSVPLQPGLSLHRPLTGVLTTESVSSSHESPVQDRSSERTGGTPGSQKPALHCSAPLQKAPSSQSASTLHSCGSWQMPDRKRTRLNSSHSSISYAVLCFITHFRI